MLPLFLASSATQPLYADDDSGPSGPAAAGLQYRVMVDGGVAVVRPGAEAVSAADAVSFEREAATGTWSRLGAHGAEPAEDARFSYAVAIQGGRAVVGAVWEDGFRGAAHVLRKEAGTWVVEARLSPADLGPYDHFGASVAIDGDMIVVGATWHDLDRGAAYVFKRVNGVWTEQAKLAASDAAVDQRFGGWVNVFGDRITVEDSRVHTQGPGSAVAYEFEHANSRWQQRRTVRPSPSAQSHTHQAQSPETILASLYLIGRVDSEPPPLRQSSPPPAPVSVNATDGIFENRVEVRWTSVGLDNVVYRILRDNVLISMASSNDSLYVDLSTNVHPGQEYEYCVRVEDMASQLSDPTCDIGSRIVFAPGSVAASDGDYDTHVRITWTDLSGIESGYHVRRNGTLIATTAANSAVYRDSTAAVNLHYEYSVAAFDVGGYSSIAMADSGWRGPLLPPTDVSASDGEHLDRIVVTWTDQSPNETGFYVFRDNDLVHSAPASPNTLGELSWEDTSIVFGTSYEYCVAAMGVHPAESRRVCDQGRTGLNTPENVAASDSTYDDRVAIRWDDVSDFEDGYEITRTIAPIARGRKGPQQEHTPTTVSTVLDTTRANTESYDDRTAVSGITYVYSVRAINTSGGGVSDYASDNGYRSVVLAPFDVKATDGTFEDRVDITWKSNSTTAVLFKIYRSGVFIKSVNAADRLYRDAGGTAGQVYDYSLVAVTGLAAEATSAPDAGKRELLKPTRLTAGDNAFEDRTVITWTENSRVEHGYLVSREDTVSAVVHNFFIGANRTSYTDYTGVSGVQYRYSVSAFDSTSGALGNSPPAQDFGIRTLLAPTSMSADKGASETEVVMRWRDESESEEGYRVYRDSFLVGSVADNSISFVDTAPILGTTHVYEVRAFDDHGESAGTVDTGYTALLSPMSFNASSTYDDRIELTWVDRSGMEDGFKIYRDGSPLAAVGPNVTGYTPGQGQWERTGGFDTPGSATAVAVAGSLTYIADDTGLYIVDISNPGSPSLVNSIGQPGISDVVVDGNFAYVASDVGINRYNVSNPAAPFISGSIGMSEAKGLFVDGTYVYVAAGTNGLKIFNPTSPVFTEIGACDTPGTAHDVTVLGGYAYVADGPRGIHQINVFNPAAPTLEVSPPLPGDSDDIDVRGVTTDGSQLVFAAAGNAGLHQRENLVHAE